MRLKGRVALMRVKRNAYRLLIGKPEGNRPLGRPRRKWVDDLKLILERYVWTGLVWLRIGTRGER
jgi:hypothetical protein